MMDGSCTFTTQCSGCGWIWMNSLGKIQLMEMWNLRMRKTALHFEVEALQCAMESMI